MLARRRCCGVPTNRWGNPQPRSDKDQNESRMLLLRAAAHVNRNCRLGFDELRVLWNMVAGDLTMESFAMICGMCGVDSAKALHEIALVALVDLLCGSDGLHEDELLSAHRTLSGMQSQDADEKNVIHTTDIELAIIDIDVSSLNARRDVESVFNVKGDIAVTLGHQAASSSRIAGSDSRKAMVPALLSMIKAEDESPKQDSTHSPSASPSISSSQAFSEKNVIHSTNIEPACIDIDVPSLEVHCDVASVFNAEGDIAVALGHQAASSSRVTGSDSRQNMGAVLLSSVKPKDDSLKQDSTPSPGASPYQVATAFACPSEWLAMPQDISHIQDVDNESELAAQTEDRFGSSAAIDNPEMEPLMNPNLEDDLQMAGSSSHPYDRLETLLKTISEDDARTVASSATFQDRLELLPKTEFEDGAQSGASSKKSWNAPEPPLKKNLEDDTQVVPRIVETQIGRSRGILHEKLEPLLLSPGDLQDMEECLRLLKEALSKSLPGLGSTWSIEIFGSAVSGFGARGCDLDVVLCQHDGAERWDPRVVLSILNRELQSSDGFAVQSALLNARIPILKLKHGDQEVDLCVNNVQPLPNTHLLKAYASLHPTVSKLGIAVKLWAKERGVCGAKDGHLSPYAFVLMVIYYLQVHCTPRMMSLQKGGADDHVFNSEDSALDLVRKYLGSGSGWAPSQGLDLLYSGFFFFYSQVFHWGTEVVSVRMGTRLCTNSRDSIVAGWKFGSRDCQRLHIEDPFELGRNLRDVLKPKNEHLLRLSLNQQAALKPSSSRVSTETPRQQNRHYRQKRCRSCPRDR